MYGVSSLSDRWLAGTGAKSLRPLAEGDGRNSSCYIGCKRTVGPHNEVANGFFMPQSSCLQSADQ